MRMMPRGASCRPMPATLEAVVQKAFSQRRKVIRNCLAGMFTEQQMIDAGIDPGARPEAVGLEQYVALANILKPRAAGLKIRSFPASSGARGRTRARRSAFPIRPSPRRRTSRRRP